MIRQNIHLKRLAKIVKNCFNKILHGNKWEPKHLYICMYKSFKRNGHTLK